MENFYHRLKAITHPISLSAIYMIISALYSFQGVLTVFGFTSFVLIVLLMNIVLIVSLLKYFLNQKNPLVPNLVAYVIWLIPVIIEYFLYKPLIYKFDYMEFSLSLVFDGLVLVVLYSLVNLELNLLALGSFSVFLFLLGLNSLFYFWALVITVLITGVYAGFVFKKAKSSLSQILISYLAGIIVYALSYYSAVYLVKIIFS